MNTTNNHHPNGEHGAGQGGQEPLATEAALLALASEVEALRARLEPLKELDKGLAELADTVTSLADEVAARERRVSVVGALSWLDLPDGVDGAEPLDTDSVARLLEGLAGWVQRVYLRYADAAKHFPECWLWHPDVIEELTWLRHAWQCAYQVEDAAPGLAWDWHDRYRPGVVRRLRELAGRCSLDNHTRRETGAAPIACGSGGLGERAAWWASNRHTAPPAPGDAVLAQARAAEAARLRNGGRR
jgi:hypothetical protein